MGTNITGIGNANAIGFKSRVTGGIYFPPELKDALVGVWSAYGKSNDSTDRNIIKNKIKDRGGDFVISNAAFKLNSGFGKYEVDFTEYRSGNLIYVSRILPNSILATTDGSGEKALLKKFPSNENDDINDYKVEIKLTEGVQVVYKYIDNTGTLKRKYLNTSGIYDLPKSYISKLPSEFNDSIGFTASGVGEIYLSQIPSFEGAFVTDGVDDLITSTKTVQEMGITDEITVVSMIGQLSTPNVNNYTNTIRNQPSTTGSYNKVEVSAIDKTGIYGYSFNSSLKCSIINDILGDKQDYSVSLTTQVENISAKYLVQGWIDINGLAVELSSVAWYWTIIASKVLTTDEINQVIAYFNLDRTLKPDILCNTIKQGITNENHAEFGDKLIDFSGNGRDIQLNNLAWKGGSGIAAKPFETIKDYNIIPDEARQELTIYNEFSYKIKSNTLGYYWTVQSIVRDNTSYQVTIVTDKDCYWVNSTVFTNSEGNRENIRKEYPVQANTPTQVIICGLDQFEYPEGIKPTNAVSYVNLRYAGEITVTFIPSYKGGLLLDGVNDFGQFVGDLGLKDYTLIMNRAYNNLINNQVPLISSNIVEDQTPFIVEHWNTGSNAISFSYGASRTTDIPLDINKKIVYQSTYSYMGYVIPKGNAISTGGGITLGKFGNGVQYSAICLWSLMLFPYSMSEFLIERQLKKHKLGTLYPDMVEFRPVIKANNDYEIVYTAIIKPDNWQEISIGDYVTVGKSVAIQIKLNLLLEVTTVSSNSLADVSFYKEETGDNVYTICGRLLDGKSPQKINITIDEYIRFEDIVQPYPVLLRFKDENGNEVSWGDKIKVGSSITRIGSAADSNLLPNIYNIFGLLLNGNQVTSSKAIVEKTMVFKAKSAYIFDNNEPKVILSPRLLRIPNSSYKILGYIPDISGHGNHGKINNSAYAGMSGANGYKQDFTSWKTSGSSYSIVTDSKYILTNEKAITNGGYFLWNRLAKDSFKVKISNIPNGGWMSYRYKITEEDTQFSSLFIRKDGIYTLPATIADSEVDFFISTVSTPAKDWIGLTIEQIGEYEGAYCLDGVDDFVTIPTLSSGGKQVLMKVNSRKSDCYLYDQRNNWTQYLGIVSTKDFIAYNYSNQRGKTYIDGILNENITANDLIGITHNITVTNNRDDVKQYSPCIGTSFARNSYAQMALYDFILFDNISTDDKIKELNEYVGIEAKVELPPYYWDAYGKTNLDGDKATIQQRGVAVGDYDLTNNNLAYEGMSGYNGYPVVFGTNKTYANLVPNDGNFILTSSHNIINVTKFDTSYGLLYSHIKLDGKLTSRNIDYPSYKIKVTGLGENFGLHYSYLESSSDTTVKGFEINNDGIYIIPKSFASDGSLTSNSDWIGFIFTGTAPESCNVTIEVLPEYENGLVYDGITDYSKNANIPALDDFTAIIKREWLKKTGLSFNKRK